MNILFPYMARWHAVNWTRYHSLLTALANRGHKIYVLQPPPLDSEETNFKEIEPVHHLNITVLDVPINQTLWKTSFPFDKLFKKAIFSLLSYRTIKRMLKTEQIDVLLLYNIPQYFISRLQGPLQVFDYADDYIDMLEQELGKFAFAPVVWVAQKLLRSMMSRADLNLSVSRELATSVEANIQVLPNGVDEEKASKSIAASRSSGAINLQNQNKPVIGFIGSFEYFIDFDVILGAAEKLPDVFFLLVGTGRDYGLVAAAVKTKGLTNIQLTGGVPHKQVFTYIDHMDICLNIFKPIPVSHRACPLKLFEYMIQKKPVISTRLLELQHIDKDFLYYADTSEELQLRILEVLENKEQAAEKANKGYRITLANYTWNSLAEQFELHIRSHSENAQV